MKKLTFILALIMLLGAFAGTFSVSAASGDVGITLAPEISTATSARLRKDSNGIRFTATVSEELVKQLKASKAAGSITNYSFGMLICKAEDLAGIAFTAEALTAAGKTFADKRAYHSLKTNEKTGDVTFSIALINLKTEHYDVPFTATAYIEYTVDATETHRIYATGETPVQSAKEMAYEQLSRISLEKDRKFPNPMSSYYTKAGDTYVKKEGLAYSVYGKAQQTVFANYINGVPNHDPNFYRPLSPKTVPIAPHMKDIFRSVGRTYKGSGGVLSCDLTCSGIRFNTFCEGNVTVKLTNNGSTGYFTVYVDGVRMPTRYSARAGTSTMTIATALPRGEHEIMLVKQGQFIMNTVDLIEVSLVGEFLAIPEEKELFIEFYGDSTVNGSNVLLQPGKGTSPETSDGTSAYGWLTAEKLNADCSIIGVGGLGVVNSGIPRYNIDVIHDITGHPDHSGVPKYDFARIPDIVVIELGVNDAVRGADIGVYKQKTRAFILKLREVYGEDVPIIWLVERNDQNFWDPTQDVINELGGEDANIFVCKTAQVSVPTSLGGDGWHPDEEGALIMAKKLVSTINKILKDKAETAE